MAQNGYLSTRPFVMQGIPNTPQDTQTAQIHTGQSEKSLRLQTVLVLGKKSKTLNDIATHVEEENVCALSSKNFTFTLSVYPRCVLCSYRAV